MTARKHIDWAGRAVRIEIFIVIVGCALLLAAVSLFLGLSGNLDPESKQVNSNEYQAVFLNNGQVYFGKLADVNNRFFVLDNVYYLESPTGQNNQKATASNSNYTLRKLGVSELHSPEDQMVINRTEVTFWENIKNDSKVVKAINQYQTNPNAAAGSQVQGTGTQTPTNSSTTPAADQ